MTHIPGVIEGYADHVFKLLKFFDGKVYANGKAKVRPRIMLPVHFGINEIGKEEFLADLKGFSLIEDFKLDDKHVDGMKDSGPALKNKVRWIFKWMRKVFPQIKDISKEMQGIKESGLRNKEMKIGNHFLAYFIPLGEVKDMRNKDGSEIV